nr:hypothetical protein [Candidatus Baldrarchaeota archaeon]
MSVADRYRGHFRIKKKFKEIFKDVDKVIELFSKKEVTNELKS